MTSDGLTSHNFPLSRPSAEARRVGLASPSSFAIDCKIDRPAGIHARARAPLALETIQGFCCLFPS